MFKRIFDILSGVPMTVVGGIFILMSFILMVLKIDVPVNPAWITVIICGIPLLYLSIFRIINNVGVKKISSALLISIAMIAAVIIGDVFAAGEVAFIMAIGAIIEDKTAERAKKGLRKLIDLVPVQGRKVFINGETKMVEIIKIVKGDIIRILPGERITVDGEIIKGNSSVDQSIMTGESLPIDKEIGDNVFSGTINCFGTIDIKTTKVGEESSLQKLIKMVEDAENKKAPMERIADTWATWLVPIALLIAIGTFFVTKDMERAVTILVVICPCALVLATPTAIMAAIGQATKYGVIIKSGEALEKMGKVDVIAFDKTGTLTNGNLVVSDIISFDPRINDSELLYITVSVESYSEHPLAKAIVSSAQDKNIKIESISDFIMIPGKGVSANFNGNTILCGNLRWLKEKDVLFEDSFINTLNSLQQDGKAIIIVAENKKCIGVIALSDTIKDSTKSMIEELKKENVETVLLTGDNKETANYFASQVGINSVHFELLPEKKMEEIKKLQQVGKYVCMIGDGVNDAPALKTADIGVAMGSMGSDIAIDAADIALMGDDITKIPYLKRLSNATVKTIKLSIILSLIINFIAVSLSIKGILTPTTGALVHNVGSILVVLIATALYDIKFI